MFTDYLRLILFAVGLLAGVQVPGFIDQYAQRVSAHQIEVATDFRGFQQVADQYFGGSVEALIAAGSSAPCSTGCARSMRNSRHCALR